MLLLGELGVVARGQPCILVGDFIVEPTKIPCLAKGISAGPWVNLEASWALASGGQPAPDCKRAWNSCGDHRRDFTVGCPLAIAAVLSCRVQSGRWIAPRPAVGTLFDCGQVQRTPLWLASWLLAVDQSMGSSRLRFRESEGL